MKYHSKRIANALHGILVSATLLCTQSITAHAGPMDTAGQLSVSESGAATYTIPIQVPPGTAGIEPKLALSYNSQAGNGLLGVGWNLSGLSAITRCPRTLAQDGVRGSINFDANDRFCLDGQRLMVISGTYGAAGSEYRTERDSFSKIIANGGTTGDPNNFKVWTKAGQIIEYGNTTGSRIEAQGKTQARAWAINKISDTKQNYLTYSYTEDSANGDYYPARIDYTGNATSTPVLTPNASVQFVYETRPDIVPMYQSGSLVKSTKRMNTISTYSAVTNHVRDYSLSYGYIKNTNSSRLVAITAKDGIGTSLPSINLVWSSSTNDGTFQPAIGRTFTTVNMSGYTPTVADVNGDGKADMVALYSNSSGFFDWVALGNGDGTFQPVQSNTLTLTNMTGYTPTVADVNGDGKADLVALYSNTAGFFAWVALGNGDGTFQPAVGRTLTTTNMSGYTPKVADVNGDGKSDMVALYSNTAGFFAWTALALDSVVAPNLMMSVSNGLGPVTTFNYLPLTNSTIYTKGSGSIYPVVDLQVPMYVVSSVQSPNGIGSGYTMTNYQYSGLKAEQGTGRGLLGFNSVTATQVDTGLSSTTTYSQSWPYVGLPTQVKKTLPAALEPSHRLNLVTNTFGCLNPSTGAACTVAAGNRYFPYLSSSVESSWDLNGTALPVVTTSNTFDLYGNATAVTVSTPDGYSKTTSNTYTNDLTNWYLGRLTRSTVQSTKP